MKFSCYRVVVLAVLLLAVTAVTASAQMLYRPPRAQPSAAWQAMDTLFMRPIGIATTVVGMAGFVGTLPISIATNTPGEAANAFVGQPAEWTFKRPLGKPGPGPDFFLP